METRADYVAVGAFVLVILVGVLVAVLWLARVEFNRDFAFYDIYFSNSVAGLASGSAVSYNGIRVGRVTELRIDPQDLKRVRATIELDQTAPIKEDTVASLTTQGLTGATYIEISGGSADAAPLTAQPGQRYPVIASRQSGFERVLTSAPEVLVSLLDVANRLRDILDDKNRTAITEMLENLRRITAAAAGRSNEIDSILGDAAVAMHDLRQTLVSANEMLADLRQLVGEKGDARVALKDIDEASRKLEQLEGHLDALVQENRPPLREFTGRGLNELSQLLVDARGLVAGLTRLVDDIERDPSRFLFGSNRREGYQPR
jgi:phospholipid/cholesterol/gamma-HCH transport system substrate-binding protein